MITKYYKDYRHNYLVIQTEYQQDSNTYQIKMITENALKGILKCQQRMINGEAFLYYDITSKQNMKSIFDGKSIQLEHLKKLFGQLKKVQELMEHYLLDAQCLLLKPEYIYADIETFDFFFVCFPDEQDEDITLTELMNFMMEHMDAENVRVAEAVYKMADLLSRQQFVLDEVLNWFEENYAEEELPQQKASERIQIPIPDTVPLFEKPVTDTAPQSRRKAEKSIFQRWFTFLFPQKSKREPCKLVDPVFQNITEPEGNQTGKENDMTLYVPWVENSENKLYGIDRGNKYHIDLGNLPLTAGKLAGAVDMVIHDSSVSRMHARFTRAGNRFYITDLNSTNGTFRNGMRLAPNACEVIEPGDEIGLGKLKFIYR